MQTVEIRIKGCLDQKWADWLDGLSIVHTDQDETILKGQLADQTAVYGVIGKLRDLGVKLITANFSEEALDIENQEEIT